MIIQDIWCWLSYIHSRRSITCIKIDITTILGFYLQKYIRKYHSYSQQYKIVNVEENVLSSTIYSLCSVMCVTSSVASASEPRALILRCYFVSFIFRYRSMTLRTCVFHIFKSFHATWNYHKTKQSKPSEYAAHQNNPHFS